MAEAVGERRRTVESEGVRLSVREWPGPETGRPLLLIHGLASSSHIWNLVAPRLARRHRVVAYDQRGHGESGKPSSGYGFEHTAADAAALIRSLRLRRPVVVGHSWGANVALELTVRHPKLVSGQVLLDGGFMGMRSQMDWRTAKEALAPPPIAGMHIDEYLGMLRRFMGDQLEYTPEVEAAFRSLMRVDRHDRIRPRLSRANHLRILRALWEQDALALLRMVKLPTLILATRRPDAAGTEQGFIAAKELAAREIRAIGRPLRFEWIEGIHDVPLQHPDVVARRIARFASGID